jgi:hypothetical protein
VGAAVGAPPRRKAGEPRSDVGRGEEHPLLRATWRLARGFTGRRHVPYSSAGLRGRHAPWASESFLAAVEIGVASPENRTRTGILF